MSSPCTRAPWIMYTTCIIPNKHPTPASNPTNREIRLPALCLAVQVAVASLIVRSSSPSNSAHWTSRNDGASRGQFFVAHDLYRIESPSQYRPPFCGLGERGSISRFVRASLWHTSDCCIGGAITERRRHTCACTCRMSSTTTRRRRRALERRRRRAGTCHRSNATITHRRRKSNRSKDEYLFVTARGVVSQRNSRTRSPGNVALQRMASTLLFKTARYRDSLVFISSTYVRVTCARLGTRSVQKSALGGALARENLAG